MKIAPDLRDALAPIIRRALCRRMRFVPFPHQAAVWCALDGLNLTEQTTYSWNTDDTSPGVEKYLKDARAFTWSHEHQDVLMQDKSVERRAVEPRPEYETDDGPMRHAQVASDLAAYKGGKSQGGALYVAPILLLPGVEWDILGNQYPIAEPEFRYVLEALVGDHGANIALKRKKATPPEFDWMPTATYQNKPRQGRMVLNTSYGAQCEARSWEVAESMKGQERDGMLYAESYQLPGLVCYTNFKQNLKARRGRATFFTTPDSPWLDILRQLGEDPDRPEWFCIHGIPRQQNPYTYDAREMETDRDIMTREKHAIAWEGKLGQYVGSVFDYKRGERLFTPSSHPEMWKDPTGPAVFENLHVPNDFILINGADTGTMYAALWAAISPDNVAFVLHAISNYRYVATEIERDKSVTLSQFYAQMGRICKALDAPPAFWADQNTQFAGDLWAHGFTILRDPHDPEARTEIAREYFQHDRIFLAPWLQNLPYELEIAKYPPEETSTGRWRRIKEKDHEVDPLEHVLAQRRRGKKRRPKEKLLGVEEMYGVRVGKRTVDPHFG